ncbi:MAG: glutamine-hydrolyzing carbamoyl-phosphate synthase small subunit [Acidimicrobiales bacterium]
MSAYSDLSRHRGWLCLADGTAFSGTILTRKGARVEEVTGEVVFNTALTGYQEVITDPSYAGQMIVFTYPHLGNYGANRTDDEADLIFARAVIAREYTSQPSNWRAEEPLHERLFRQSIPLMVDVDTRRLTRYLRTNGALPGVLGAGPLELLAEHAAKVPSTEGIDLVSSVTPSETTYYSRPGAPRVVAVDFGMKTSMIRLLGERFEVVRVPASVSAEEILSLSADAVFLSNGPGDPAPLHGPISTIRDLVGRVPIFGICLGHQLLGLALGGRTIKLRFGHHGANHPVSDLSTHKVEITSQNHNYALDADSIASMTTKAVVSHTNLNDGVVEGLVYPEIRAFSVQYHPEAGPGPHDARYLFARFEQYVRGDSIHAEIA